MVKKKIARMTYIMRGLGGRINVTWDSLDLEILIWKITGKKYPFGISQARNTYRNTNTILLTYLRNKILLNLGSTS